MKKIIIISILLGVVALGAILAGISMSPNSNTINSSIVQESDTTIPPEGKSYVIELNDSVTSSTP